MNTRRTTAFAAALTLAAQCICLTPVSAKQPPELDKAKPISFTKQEQCSYEKDTAALYSFELDKRGYINIAFGRPETETLPDGSGWTLTVYDTGNYELFTFDVPCGAEETINFRSLGLEAGKYYLAVDDLISHRDEEFTLELTGKYTDNFEAEPNSGSLYNTIEPGRVYQGICPVMGGYPDEDDYSFTMEENGYVEIEFSVDDCEDPSAWDVFIMHEDDTSCTYLQTNEFYSSEGSMTITPRYTLPAGEYRLMIRRRDEFKVIGAQGTEQRYTFTLRAAADPYWDINAHSRDNAMPIEKGIKYHGTLGDEPGREDIYVFDDPAAGTIPIVFETGKETDPENKKWRLTVENEKGEYLDSFDIDAEHENLNTYPIDLPKGRIYLIVSAPSWTPNAVYGLQVGDIPKFAAYLEQSDYGCPDGIDVTLKASDGKEYKAERKGSEYVIDDMPDGQYDLSAKKEGYEPIYHIVDVFSTTSLFKGTLTRSSSSEPLQEEDILPNEDKFSRGDVNMDGKITVTDISMIAAHVKGIKALNDDAVILADVNFDSKVTVTDISKTAGHVKGIKSL